MVKKTQSRDSTWEGSLGNFLEFWWQSVYPDGGLYSHQNSTGMHLTFQYVTVSKFYLKKRRKKHIKKCQTLSDAALHVVKHLE